MRTIYIDIETRSDCPDIKRAGAHKYAESAEILLIAYAWDNGPVEIVDVINGESVPLDVTFALDDPKTLKIAHNAAFERAILSSVHHRQHPASEWRCTAAWAAYAGLPRSLGQACRRAGVQEKAAGARLIKKFTGDRMLDTGYSGSDWEEFKAYNRQDVESLRELHRWLQAYPMPPQEWEVWAADQEINDRGVLIERRLVREAIRLSEEYRGRLLDEARKLTGLNNPNSVAQLKSWLDLDENAKLARGDVQKMLDECTDSQRYRVLEIRQALGKSSVAKYQAMADMVMADGRVRGTLLYYGAATGRWSGRGVQYQNLPRMSMREHEAGAREMVISGRSLDELDITYGDPMAVLSALLRTAIIAPEGTSLRVDDYSQIEARVAAWLANETWVLDTFRQGRPYYETTASKLYGVPVSEVDKGLRQRGKAAALALQYGGWTGALERVGGITLPMEQQVDICRRWRAACPAIVAMWERLRLATVNAVSAHTDERVGRLTVRSGAGGCLYIDLPGGRSLIYREPQLAQGADGKDLIEYTGRDGTREQLWAGLIMENVCQAVARDVLAEQLMASRDTCVLHVHDEIVLEGPQVPMIRPEWAEGLPLDMSGFCSPWYRKE